ncbi:hypothetical protein QNI19_28920 [Cytophagaceae bacterium DM2B3-1]|uniref:DUF3316 domain-containing protein n=1 Tax=Xanthocytophaga flava TaxID=3048013 RepID=A0ABT7CTB8_9BACT|nr:hypothetical protein [Xanthocytophaga flavus]MDJ1472210.1 hypothetical protein [Xanthocytophaga flavus]MDJ1496994.1 hypothetical protein [Xanthocytophaga flavus]
MKICLSLFWESLIWLLCLIYYPAFGQQTGTFRSLQLQVGSESIYLKDYFHAPFTYKGIQSGLLLRYENTSQNHIWFVESSYMRGSIQSSISVKAHIQQIGCDFSYLHQVVKSLRNRERFRLYVGATLSNYGFLANYNPDLEYSGTQATLSLAMALSVRVSYQLKSAHQLVFVAQSPFVAWLYRPDYAFNGNYYTEMVWPGTNITMHIALTYNYNWKKNWQLTAMYQYNYSEYMNPQALFLLRQGIFAGVKKLF